MSDSEVVVCKIMYLNYCNESFTFIHHSKIHCHPNNENDTNRVCQAVAGSESLASVASCCPT